MKYFEVEFRISPYSDDASDLLAALAGEAGFETFESVADGLKGYVQQSLFDEQVLKESLSDFPFEGVAITYDIREAEDRDWNEQWEQEGFEPIIISDGALVIHDGRHLPETEGKISIEIDAKLAFGTGTHETTRMICSQLLELSGAPELVDGPRVLDCGTGTGILSICALKLGATEAVGYDIDEWSVDNARHNAVINHVDDRFTSLLGDASILNKVEGEFNLVLANINRNILLADMPQFRTKMAPGAMLILSGFYTADGPMLIDKAQTLGLTLHQQVSDGDWACLVFKS
jgi:ribosomal protein L11 methyltransferase